MKRRRAPFVVQGVHSDNGSEYINRKVPKLLEKLRIPLCQHSCPLTSVSNYYLVPVYKCQVIEIQLKNRKKTMRNPVQDGTIMI